MVVADVGDRRDRLQREVGHVPIEVEGERDESQAFVQMQVLAGTRLRASARGSAVACGRE